MLVPEALAPSPQEPMEAPGWSCGRKHRSVRWGECRGQPHRKGHGSLSQGESASAELCMGPSPTWSQRHTLADLPGQSPATHPCSTHKPSSSCTGSAHAAAPSAQCCVLRTPCGALCPLLSSGLSSNVLVSTRLSQVTFCKTETPSHTLSHSQLYSLNHGSQT